MPIVNFYYVFVIFFHHLKKEKYWQRNSKKISESKKVQYSYTLIINNQLGPRDMINMKECVVWPEPVLMVVIWPVLVVVVVQPGCCCRYYSQQLGTRFDHSAETLLQALINLIPNSAKIMATSGLTCIRFLLQVWAMSRLRCVTCPGYSVSQVQVMVWHVPVTVCHMSRLRCVTCPGYSVSHVQVTVCHMSRLQCVTCPGYGVSHVQVTVCHMSRLIAGTLFDPEKLWAGNCLLVQISWAEKCPDS